MLKCLCKANGRKSCPVHSNLAHDRQEFSQTLGLFKKLDEAGKVIPEEIVQEIKQEEKLADTLKYYKDVPIKTKYTDDELKNMNLVELSRICEFFGISAMEQKTRSILRKLILEKVNG